MARFTFDVGDGGGRRGRLRVSGHALVRMRERGISSRDLVEVYRKGTVVETRPNDTPYPSHVLKGRVAGRVICLVIAECSEGDAILVTVYARGRDRG